MKIAYLMVGVPGSGKSTAARQLVAGIVEKRVEIFSLDECRLSFACARLNLPSVNYSTAFDLAVEYKKDFDQHVSAAWTTALRADILFIDNTNLSRKSRARWCAEARAHKFEIWAIVASVPLQIAIDRQSTRPDKCIPAEIISDMYYSQQEVLLGSEVDNLLLLDSSRGLNTYFSVLS